MYVKDKVTHRIKCVKLLNELSDITDPAGPKKFFEVGRVKFANSLSPPSIVKKVCSGIKSSQGT